MKKCLYVPAIFALTIYSAHAQETPGGTLETDIQTQTRTQIPQPSQSADDAASELDRAAARASAGTAGSAPDFSEADADGNGELSIEEAKDALPADLVIIDTNNDGKLNQSEVESLVPGLLFNEDGSPADEGSTIGAAEYEQIVQAWQERSADTASVD